MKLVTLLNPSHIVLGLEADTVTDAIPELLSRAESFKPGKDVEEISEAVLKREHQSSTAAELGVAIPHARISGLSDFYILLGLTARPMSVCGLDDRPIEIVVLILSDDEKNALMLQSMAAIAMLSQKTEILERIRTAPTREAVLEAFKEADLNVRKTLQARDIMRSTPLVASEDMALRDLLDKIFEHGVGEAPVCDDAGKVVGCVTSAEIIEAGFPDYMDRIPDIGFLPEFEAFERFFKREGTIAVRDILNKEPLVVDAEDPIIRVVFLMRRNREPFAYVEENGRFVGVIDRNDIVSRVLRA